MQYSRDMQPSEKAAKEAVFLFSTPEVVVILDSNLKLLDKVKIAQPEAAIETLSKGGWLPEEEALLKKGQGKSVVVIGFKSEKRENVSFSQDIKKLEAAYAAAQPDTAVLRKLAIAAAKKAVALSVNDDSLIIQSASSIDELNKTISLLVKRLREWYGLYNPEFSEACTGNEEFVHAVAASSQKPSADGMGGKLAKSDIDKIVSFAALLESLYDSRKSVSQYVEVLMKRHCPNMATVAGASTGSQLILQAGSLQRLAMLPSSTIQLLGAEKELFKHLKDKKQKPPKAGVIQGHPLVTSAPRMLHGRIAKLLADKISIAARVDFFKGEFIGDRLLAELEKKVADKEARK